MLLDCTQSYAGRAQTAATAAVLLEPFLQLSVIGGVQSPVLARVFQVQQMVRIFKELVHCHAFDKACEPPRVRTFTNDRNPASDV